MFLSIQEAQYLQDYKVKIKFTDGKIGIVDLQNELYGTVFKPLKNKKLFSTLKVDKDLETIVWDNGADLAPEYLYFKAFKNDKNLKQKFKEWGYI